MLAEPLAVSTHAPRVHGERLQLRPPGTTTKWFQPTLPAFTGSDLPPGPRLTSSSGFNPRSPRSRGATVEGRRAQLPGEVSTHAPRVHGERRRAPKGEEAEAEVSTHAPRVHGERRRTLQSAGLELQFQPTLPAFTGSDHGPPAVFAACFVFQPTLPAFTGSDHLRREGRLRLRVSTHAPRVHGERLEARGKRLGIYGFNPRSPRSRGATTTSPRVAKAMFAFQPTLPAFTRSDKVQSVAKKIQTRGFNPRSPRSRGATSQGPPSSRLGPVSTHAPRVHEERRRSAPRLPYPSPASFNPRSPRSRGATGGVVLAREPEQVSTHAPRVHGERPSGLGGALLREIVSTHAPRVHGERLPSGAASMSRSQFQPTLPAFTGSDEGHGAAERGLRVSTHAPRVHGERLTTSRSSGRSSRFQPTLPAFTGSDWNPRAVR